MDVSQAAVRFDQVAQLLPGHLRQRVQALPQEKRAKAEELRLRRGRSLFVLTPQGEEALADTLVTAQDLETVLELASASSVHTVMEQIKHGFVGVRGGHRLGLCGTGVVENGKLVNLRELSSLSLRVAREFKGLCREVLLKLWGEHGLENTLILSPPGGGKTTLLRDLIRAISAGDRCPARRVGVADERGELAAVSGGVPTLDIGPRSDVMSGCPKDIGLMTLLRGMNPQVLAVDEITAPEDVAAMTQAAGCGVTLLATAHGGTLRDLDRRPLYRELMAQGVFGRLVVIRGTGDERRYTVTDGAGRPC